MRILIVGLGSIARKHIAAARAVDSSTEFFALRSNSQAAEEDGIANIFSREQAAAIEADFAIISNPTSEHIQTIDWLVELAIPLFIEKPLSDALQIEQSVKKCESVLTYVACNLRFLECLVWVAKNMVGKRINEVNAYCGSYLPEWRVGADWRKVYSANRSMGGGVHIDLIHEIDYLYWLLGRPSEIRKTFRADSSLEIDAFDYANYCLIYDNFAVSVILNYYRRDYKRTLELVFDDETWMVDLAKNRVVCGDRVLFQAESITNTYQSQMLYFMNLVKQTERKSINPIEEAYNVLKICLEDETTR